MGPRVLLCHTGRAEPLQGITELLPCIYVLSTCSFYIWSGAGFLSKVSPPDGSIV